MVNFIDVERKRAALVRALEKLDSGIKSILSMIYDILSPSFSFDEFSSELDNLVRARFELKFNKWYLRYFSNGKHRSLYVGDDGRKLEIVRRLELFKILYAKKKMVERAIMDIDKLIELADKKASKILKKLGQIG